MRTVVVLIIWSIWTGALIAPLYFLSLVQP